jgi:hypothetical protein
VLVLALTLTSLVLAVSGGATPEWATGAPHRWVQCGSRTVCATENGGRSWRRLLKVPVWDREQYSAHPSLSSVVRSSRTTGVAVVQPYDYVLWTRDRGRRWLRTLALATPNPTWCIGSFPSGPPWCQRALRLVPRGTHLYLRVGWSYDNGCPAQDCHVQRNTTLYYRVAGWPPRRTPRCVSGWLNALHRLPNGLRPNGLYDPTRKLKGKLPATGNVCADDLWGAHTLHDALTAVEIEAIPPP